MKSRNRNIPNPIKLQLRQEAGFGCCVCGHPLIEYHHIIPFSKSPFHDPKHMMVLCPIHHHECTVRAMSEKEQIRAKTYPYNKTQGLVNGYLKFDSSFLAIEAGNIQFIGSGFKCVVDREPLLSVNTDSEGRLLLSVNLYDEHDNMLVSIHNNEWISGNPFPWDIKYGINSLSLHQEKKKVSLNIDARSSILVQAQGELWRKNQLFSISHDGIKFNGKIGKISNAPISFSNLGLVCLSLAANSIDGSLKIIPDERFRSGEFISAPNLHERIKTGIEIYYDLCKDAKIGRNEPCPCGSGKKFKSCHQA